MSKKIIFSTGGTGGHIFPAINLMKHYFENGYEVLLVTDSRGKKFIKNFLEFRSYILKTGTLTKRNIFIKFFSIILIVNSIIKSFIILKKEKPDLVFGFGGYVSFPICFASRFFKIPLVIYENNMILGRANKYLSSSSKKILTAKKITNDFSTQYKNKIHKVGSILDKDIINFQRVKNISEKNFSILVLGGSQGAEIFGKIVPSVIKLIKKKGHDIEINQQCITSQKILLQEFYKKNEIKNYIFEFDSNILKLILSADLAITRCGASTTAELTHTLTPFIAVPIPNSIDNHQYLNAKYYESNGCCWLLEQNNFNTDNLFNLIIETMKNKNKLEKVKENMRKNYNRDVYKDVEKEIKELI